MRIFVLSLCTLLLLAPQAHSAISVTSQARSVSASATTDNYFYGWNDSASDSDAATDASPFGATAVATAAIQEVSATGNSSQTSSIATNSILAFGSASADAESQDLLLNSEATSSASSDFEVVFTIAQTAAYNLSGTLSAIPFSGTSVTLTGPGGVVFSASESNAPAGTPFSSIGSLAPGEYTISASASVNVSTIDMYIDGGSQFDLSLSIEKSVSVDPSSWSEVKAAHR